MLNVLIDWDPASGSSVIATARPQLRTSMRDDVNTIFIQVPFGHLPTMALPQTLRPKSSEAEKREEKESPAGSNPNHSGSPGSGKVQQTEKWHSVNPSPVKSWLLPKGTEFVDVFDHTDEKKRAWSSGWPRHKHHRRDELVYCCLRYQVISKCRA